MKVELSIKATYLSDWGVLEGIRELVQNARDAEVDGFPMTISSPRKKILRIENEGVSLSHKVLLFGHTTKEGREDQIGQFGEGFKLGVLALIRAGRKVKVYSGDEIWTPVIDRSRTFDEDVLCFKISRSTTPKDVLRIDVEFNVDEWEEQKKNFLFLHSPKKFYENYYGTLIMDEEYAGKIFVKGIFVQVEEGLQHGYDLKGVDVDRDRRVVRGFDVEYTVMNIWKEAALADEQLRDPLYDLLVANTKDIRSFEYHNYLTDDLLNHFANRWKEECGEAYPVTNDGEAQELGHLGATGIVVPSKPLVGVLWQKFGGLTDVKQKLMGNIVKTYELSELSPLERINYLKATNIVSNAVGDQGSTFRDIISIVKFNSDKMLGQFKQERIYISRKTLHSCSSAIGVIAHEAAHFYGSDGHKGHVDALEKIWKNIAKQFLKES